MTSSQSSQNAWETGACTNEALPHRRHSTPPPAVTVYHHYEPNFNFNLDFNDSFLPATVTEGAVPPSVCPLSGSLASYLFVC